MSERRDVLEATAAQSAACQLLALRPSLTPSAETVTGSRVGGASGACPAEVLS